MKLLRLELKKSNIKSYCIAVSAVFACFIVFAFTGHILSLVNNNLQIMDIATAFRNALVLACLTDGIVLCSLRIGFIRKSNSMTVISATGLSMLLVNLAADINKSFAVVFGLSASIFTIGLLLTWDMARKVERMEV